MSTAQRGLRLGVVRPAGQDSTLGGVSAKAENLTLVGVTGQLDNGPTTRAIRPLDRDSRVFTPDHHAPAVALEIRRFGDSLTASLIPVEDHHDGYRRHDAWGMAGGNYAATSDSRVGDLLEELLGHRFYGAIAIHDRIERH